MAIYRGPGGSGDATDDAANAAELIIQKTAEAAAYSTSAAASATAAAASATSAAASASGVSAYADAAAASAAAALTSKNNAADSETNAAISAANASTSAGTASTASTNAASSASSATTSATNAASSATAAASSASSASSSAVAAASSASSASTSASNAAISETNAASSASLAAGYFPSATGNTGKYLRTNGTTNYWDTVDALPTQTGNSGKFLTTNGTAASWAIIAAAAPTDDGLLYGLTDAGTYYPPATVPGCWFYQPSVNSIYTDTLGSFNGSSGPGTVCAAGVDGTISVGKTLTLRVTALSTGTLVSVNVGTITSVVIPGTLDKITITFSNTTIDWSLYQHTNPDYGSYLIVDSLILSGNKAENVLLGYSAGNNITTGGENVVVGASAGSTLTEGRNNVIIGNAAEPSSATVNHEITLGNSSHTKTRLYGALALGGSSVGTSGQILTSNGSGSAPSWSTPSSGTVTSVALTAPTGLTVSGSPITSSGTLALSLTAGYSIPTTSSQTNWDSAYTDRMKWDGGATGLVASTGRTSLGLVIGTDIPSVSGTGASGTWGISISGNAATVSNGLYSTGSYSDPTWLTTLAGSKITGTINGGTY